MSRSKDLRKQFEDVKARTDATRVHIEGVAKNVRDEIEVTERSIDLARVDAIELGQIASAKSEVKQLGALLRDIESYLAALT